MKRLLMLLMAFCLVIPTMNAQNKVLEKARQKEYKTKMKQFKKEKWQVFGTSRSLDVALLAHYDKLNTLGDEAQEVMGVATKVKSKIIPEKSDMSISACRKTSNRQSFERSRSQ